MAAPVVVTPAVTPWQAARAYAGVDRGLAGTGAARDADPATAAAGFGATLARALGDVVQSGQTAEAKAAQAISGKGSITDVVTAVSKAELALQTTVAVRDRVVQAYQDIMRMPI